MMLKVRLFLLMVWFFSCGQVARAGEFGEGVQLFLGGRWQEASVTLSQVVERGTANPLVYYYRGLARYRLGQLSAADSDFATGAKLELAHQTKGVGLALQRVQGRERLRLETHRRITRDVEQPQLPSAPRPVVPRPVATSNTAAGQLGIPLFRLSSEVPRRRPALPDPFPDDGPGSGSESRIATSPDGKQPGTEPVGSGVATTEETQDLEGLDDPFALDLKSSRPGEERPAAPATQPAERSGGGVFGAMFRALRNATVPKLDASALLPGGEGPGTVKPADFPEDSFPDEDPFADPSFEDTELGGDDDPFGFDE